MSAPTTAELDPTGTPMTEDEAVDRAVAAALRADGQAGRLAPNPALIDCHLDAARTWLRIADALHSRPRRRKAPEE